MHNQPVRIQQGIDVAALIAWQDRCEKFGRDFLMATAIARDMRRRLPAHERAQVEELIEILKEAMKPLQPPVLYLVKLRPDDPLDRLFNYQRRCVQVGIWSTAALALYANDEDGRTALTNFAQMAFGPGDHWTYTIGGKTIPVEKLRVLSRTLVENHLRNWKDWRQASDPRAWIGRVGRDLAKQMAWEEAPLGFRTEEADGEEKMIATVPLDEIAGTPYESSEAGTSTEPRYNEDLLLAKLLDEVRSDPTTDPHFVIYVRDRTLGDTHKQIRARHGWSTAHARNLQDVFYRRRQKLLAQGVGIEYVVTGHPAISDASRTIFREYLYDIGRGKGSYVFRHRERRS